jgi:excisionase family DNA binding protein
MKREVVLDRPRVLYRVEEAAELLSVSRNRIYELIRSNQLRTVQVGKCRRVPARSLDEYVARLLRGSAGRDRASQPR